MLGLIILLACPVAHAEEPTFATMKKGETAPFDGRLLNNAAITKFIVEDRTKIEQCNIQVEYEVNKTNTKSKYKYDILATKCEADDQRLQDMITIRDDEIKFLRKSFEPPKNHWWVAGGFLAGTASTIAVMYAVTPGLR